jgi:hypothetical protein
MRLVGIQSNKGSALFIAVLVLAATSMIIGFSIYNRSQNMGKIGNTYRGQVMSSQVAHELEVIFANPTLCKNLIKITGTNFVVTGGFQTTTESGAAVLSADKSVLIKQMLIQNAADLGSGLKRADFTVQTQKANDQAGNSAHQSKFTAVYTADASGNLTDCRLAMTAQEACSEIGMTYSGGRCQLCEKMGGTWSGSVCAFTR